MKLTPWFPADVLPVREGVYEVQPMSYPGPFYRYFDGERWWVGGQSTSVARELNGEFQPNFPLPWRGLTAEGKQ